MKDKERKDRSRRTRRERVRRLRIRRLRVRRGRIRRGRTRRGTGGRIGRGRMGEEGEEKLSPHPPSATQQNSSELCSATELLKFKPDPPSPQSDHPLLTTSLRPPDFLIPPFPFWK